MRPIKALNLAGALFLALLTLTLPETAYLGSRLIIALSAAINLFMGLINSDP